MAKLTGEELVRMQTPKTATQTFVSLRNNGKILRRTNYLNETSGKKEFGDGWKLKSRIKGWKKMDRHERDRVLSSFIQHYGKQGFTTIAGTRKTALV